MKLIEVLATAPPTLPLLLLHPRSHHHDYCHHHNFQCTPIAAVATATTIIAGAVATTATVVTSIACYDHGNYFAEKSSDPPPPHTQTHINTHTHNTHKP